ncbi:TRAP transporter small permease [Pelagibacterium flavum]|uniref:TRAP transporter small permease protein n=1 Tax=Pelagibacterium flavum TaxID=2984530 RepID=A0ABY6IKL8_9HYPH|nr:TRAP transporter small permease [Pelagibacterium sp. YIM 151497]UYQ70904.1 TRAP transporter small permease [Pelagibacterium sp. YIM 151497]
MRRFLSSIADIQIERLIGVVALLAIFVVMLTGVVLRYGFSFSLTWYEEFGRYGLILITGLGIGAGIKNRSHIVIDNGYLPVSLREAATLLSSLVTLAFLCALAWYAYALAGALRASRSPALQLPTGWFYTAIAILALLGVARVIERALRAKSGS